LDPALASASIWPAALSTVAEVLSGAVASRRARRLRQKVPPPVDAKFRFEGQHRRAHCFKPVLVPHQHEASSVGGPILVDDITGVVAEFSFQSSAKGIGIAIGRSIKGRQVRGLTVYGVKKILGALKSRDGEQTQKQA
jgi:hypothetical protein